MMKKYTILCWKMLVVLMTLSVGTSTVFAKNSHNSAVLKMLSKPSLFKKICGADAGFNVTKKAVFVAKLDRKSSLYRLDCALSAYNLSSVYYVVKGQSSRKAILQHFYEFSAKGKRSRVKKLVNADYDKNSKMLTSFRKYMGAGLCGHAGAYKWIGTGFRLKKFVLQESCDPGKTADHWPVIYPKKR